MVAAAGTVFGANRGVQAGGGEVRLKYASFDPAVGVPLVPASMRATAENELYLVQFKTTPLESMRDEIRALGGTVERFLTDNTHVVRLPAAARQQVSTMAFVRWVGAYEPAYRMSDEVRADVLADDGVARIYSIEAMRSGPGQQTSLADLVTAMGGQVLTLTLDQHRMEARLTPRQVLTIAQQNEVNFIDPGTGGVMETDMDIMRQVGGAVPTLSTQGFLGQGVRGEVFDGGVALNHQQWNGQAILVHGTTGQSSHGAACFGINFATGTGNVSATGMLPQREQGIFCASNMSTQFGGSTSRLVLNTQATDPNGQYRSCFQTSSVGSPRVTTYTTISAEVDDYLFKVDYLSCQSQSNAGGTRDSRPQAWAKNIVAVGGLTHNNTVTYADDAWATGASVGPAADLRQKPDLSHSFNNVFTTSYTSSNPTASYTQFSGTSSATPITAGHFGLLHQMWHEGVWAGFGGGSTVFGSRPKSTTAKALAINTAHRYPVTQGNMVRARVGWGMIHLGNAYTLRDRTFIVNETDVLLQGETKSYTVEVAAGEPEFKATMVFSDPQGNPAAAQARVNDLTLKVTDPNGNVYYGNNGMVATAISGAGQLTGANHSTAGGAPNTVDTVENVFVQNPMAGAWTVEVVASQIVQDARLETPGVTDADFALVISGVTVAGGCYANCDGSTTEPVLNVADFSCFLSQFAAGEPYANCDQSTEPPVLNMADFSCFLTAFAAGCR